MNRWPIVIAASALTVISILSLRVEADQGADVDLRAAMELETVRGDVKGALAAYQKIVDTPGNDRRLVAQALLRMAAAYSKLGRAAEARAIYERIVADFRDLPQAAAAQERLPEAHPTAAAAHTEVWAGVGRDGVPAYDNGTPSSDGRWLTFTDWTTGDLAIRDLSAGVNRRVTRQPSRYADGYAAESLLSSDGKRIVYAFVGKTGVDLRIINADGTDGRTLFSNADVEYVTPLAWSPDGRRVVAAMNTRGRAVRISLITIPGGTETVLKTLPWDSLGTLRLSPDGSQIAYDTPTGGAPRQRRIMKLAIDASREVALTDGGPGETVVGWSPDGSKLLFTAERTGQRTLFSVAAETDGAGKPSVLRADVGLIRRALGISKSGALFYSVSTGTSDVYATTWDPTRHEPRSQARLAGQQTRGFSQSPAWSRDGRVLAFKSGGSARGTRVSFVFVSVESGDERQVLTNLRQSGAGLSFAPDGKSVVVVGIDDTSGRRGIYSVDAQTGALTAMVLDGPGETIWDPQWLPSGEAIAFSRLVRDGSRPNERVFLDPRTGRERIAPHVLGLLSPDGRSTAIRRGGGLGSSDEPTVLVGPLDGPHRELYRGHDVRAVGWTPDSRQVLLRTTRVMPGGREIYELHRVAIDDGDRSVIAGLDPSAFSVVFSPDGRHVAYETRGSAQNGGIGIWKMDGLFAESDR